MHEYAGAPSIGQVVHYVEKSGVSAAVVLKIHSATVLNLLVHGDDKDHRVSSVGYSATPKDGHWSWPTSSETAKALADAAKTSREEKAEAKAEAKADAKAAADLEKEEKAEAKEDAKAAKKASHGG